MQQWLLLSLLQGHSQRGSFPPAFFDEHWDKHPIHQLVPSKTPKKAGRVKEQRLWSLIQKATIPSYDAFSTPFVRSSFLGIWGNLLFQINPIKIRLKLCQANLHSELQGIQLNPSLRSLAGCFNGEVRQNADQEVKRVPASLDARGCIGKVWKGCYMKETFKCF